MAADLQVPVEALARQTISEYLERRRAPGASPRVLIFDQFEEVLTVAPADHEGKLGFFAQLGHDALAGPTPDSAGAWLWLARGLVGVLCDAVVLAVGVPVLGRLLSLSGGPAAAPFLLILAAAGCFIVADLDSLLAIPAWSARLLIVVGWVALTVAGLTQLALERAEARRARLLREHLVRIMAAEPSPPG